MLELSRAGYSYGEQIGLADVTVTIGDNQLVALAGANGSGKSTLLKIAARVLAPSSGMVRFGGRPASQWSARDYARNVGYLPQEPDVAFSMRAADVVVSGRAPFLTRFGWESAGDYDAAAEALAMCDAAYLSERFLDEMSGGERKRVFLARVLAGRPKLVLLDEPLSALDVAHAQQFSRLLRSIVDRTGATIVFASHDLNWAAAYSDRVLVMRNGTLAADVAPKEFTRPELIRDLFGFDADTVTVNGRRWIVPRM